MCNSFLLHTALNTSATGWNLSQHQITVNTVRLIQNHLLSAKNVTTKVEHSQGMTASLDKWQIHYESEQLIFHFKTQTFLVREGYMPSWSAYSCRSFCVGATRNKSTLPWLSAYLWHHNHSNRCTWHRMRSPRSHDNLLIFDTIITRTAVRDHTVTVHVFPQYVLSACLLVSS